MKFLLESSLEDAKNEFGTTTNWKKAAYINTDGTMLDFSYGSAKRVEDHRSISFIYNDIDGTDAMIKYMLDGNIRFLPEGPGLDMIKEPTQEQYKTIKNLCYNLDELYIDFTNEKGYTIDSIEYNKVSPNKVVNDIKEYFKTGKVPQQSITQQFSESVKNRINRRILNETKYIELNYSIDDINDYINTHYRKTKDIDSLKSTSHLINRDGYFIDLGNNTHIQILKDLVNNNIIKSKDSDLDKINLINTDLFTELGYIRCNSDIHEYTYIQLPKTNITSAQYETLRDWLDDVASKSDLVDGEIHIGLDVSIIGGPSKYYSYVPDVDYIINRIKRYYVSGNLYESKTRSDLDDLTGKQFGELTVLEHDKEKSRGKKDTYWKCRCSCGKITSVARKHLIDGSIKSCGHTKRQNGLDHADNFNGMRDRQNKYNTNLEVIRNQKMQPNNTSGVKGVHYNKTRGRWVAEVSIGGKNIRKDFKNKEDAIKYRQELVDTYYKPKIDSAIKNGDLKETLSKYEDKETLFETLPELLYHATLKEYLPNILKNGLKDFWVGQDVEECIEYVKMNHDCEYEDIVCIEIPKGVLSAENCDFTEDMGDGWSDDWSGTFIYYGNISVESFDSYWVDEEKWYYLSKNMLDLPLKEDLELSNEYDSEGNQLTKAQAEFFKNSKVRDSHDRLLVCYRRDPLPIDTFDKDKTRDGWLGKGFYFSLNKRYIRRYGKFRSDVYLNIQNPYIVKGNSHFDILTELRELLNKLAMGFDNVQENLIELGYDGIFYKDWDPSIGQMYIAFDPNQIKSITNKNPTNNDNINESLEDNYNNILQAELKPLNNWLDKYGFEIKLVDDYKFDNDSSVGMFLNSEQDNASIFPIALNKNALINGSKELSYDKYSSNNELTYALRGTLWHEAGHGIFRFLSDIYYLDDLDEEETVEEFAEYQEESELFDILAQYNREYSDNINESIVYRGLGVNDLSIPRYLSKYTGTFFSPSEAYASMYGDVNEYDLDDDTKIYKAHKSNSAISELDLGSFDSKLLKEFTTRYLKENINNEDSSFFEFSEYESYPYFECLDQWYGLYEDYFGEDYDYDPELESFSEWCNQIVLKEYLEKKGYDGIYYAEEDGEEQYQIWNNSTIRKITESVSNNNLEQKIINKLKSLGYNYTYRESGWRDKNDNLITNFSDDWEPEIGDWYYDRNVRFFRNNDNNIEFSWDIDETNKVFTIITLWTYQGAKKGEATRLLETCLNMLPSGWKVEIKDNISRGYWNHIQSKFPQFRWENVSESLKEELENDIIVYTYQSPEVLKTLNKNKTYLADYNLGMFSDYDENPYKELSRVLELSGCPIFGALDKGTLDYMMRASGLKSSDRPILLKLRVPKSAIKFTDYYDWTDYMYALEDQEEFESESGITINILEKELKTQLPEYKYDTLQVVLDRIEPSWVIKGNLEEDLDLHTTKLNYVKDNSFIGYGNFAYIDRDGYYINGNSVGIHNDLAWEILTDNGFEDFYIDDYDSDGTLQYSKGFIAIRCDSFEGNKISIPREPSYRQYEELLKFLDYCKEHNSSEPVQVYVGVSEALNGKVVKRDYSFKDYIPDEILDKIKQYYANGRLEEKLEPIDSKIEDNAGKVDTLYNIVFSDLKEDLWNKDGYYQPEKDSKYQRLLRKPINQLTYEELEYLYVIYNCWYMNQVWHFDTYEDAYKRIITNEEDSNIKEYLKECYEFISKLEFPLTIYRAIRENEYKDGKFNISGKNSSRSWTTNLEIYTNDTSKFKHSGNIVSCKIDSNIVDNANTINNFIHYTSSKHEKTFGEYEITLKSNFKQSDLQDLHWVDKDGNGYYNKLNESLEQLPNGFITDSPYDVLNLLTNKSKPYRILYDANIDKYMIGDAWDTIHLKLLEEAIKQGYYSDNQKVKDVLNELVYMQGYTTRDLLLAVPNYFDTGTDGEYNIEPNINPYLIVMFYLPNAEDNGEAIEDGYDKQYKGKVGTIYTRGSDLEDCELYRLWTKYNKEK